MGRKPHPRSDIAEFHLRAGRHEEAAAIWAELKASDPDDVWLYNAAGLSYNEIGEHELAVEWLGAGIELAMRTDDPEGIINQLSDVRRQSLDALGRDLDELEERVGPFMEDWRSQARTRSRRMARLIDAANSIPVIRDTRSVHERDSDELAVSISWFPTGEYERGDQALAEPRRGLGRRPARALLRSPRRQHQVDAEPGRSDPCDRTNRRRGLFGLVRRAG